MRIISKFRDYYDGFSEFNNKDYLTKVWVRKEEDIEVPYNKVKCFIEKLNVPRDFFHCYFIIAGKVIPFMYKYAQIKDKYGLLEYKTFYYYSFKDLIKGNPNLFKKRKTRYYDYYSGSKKHIMEFFNKSYPDMTSLCLEVGSPILLFKPYHCGYHSDWTNDSSAVRAETNVPLMNMGITKIYSAPEMYQMLDVFVSNILMVNDNMPEGKQTDVEKIEAHGFDKVKSFRKDKENGK